MRPLDGLASARSVGVAFGLLLALLLASTSQAIAASDEASKGKKAATGKASRSSKSSKSSKSSNSMKSSKTSSAAPAKSGNQSKAAVAPSKGSKRARQKAAPLVKSAPETVPAFVTPANPTPANAAPASGPRTEGQVVQVTVARAFLDAGVREGLRVGLGVELHRGGSLVGRCSIDRVADHSASCIGASARAGDRFALGAPPPPVKTEELPPLVPIGELSRRKQVVEGAVMSGVEFTSGEPPKQPPAPRVFLRASQLLWAATDASVWQGQQLDVRVLGVQLTDGTGRLPATQLSLDVTFLHLARPDVASFRAGAGAQLYVWEASLASHPRTGVSVAFDRLLPWYAPGATRLDGAQLGEHIGPNLELGVYGGGVPDPGTLEPTFSRGTVGGYWALERSGARSDLFPYLSTTGRLAWVRSPETGTRVELESSSIAQLSKAGDFAADLRFGVGDTQGPGALDAARLSFNLRPATSFSVTGSFRYSGASLLEDTALVVASGPSIHSDLAVSWEARRSLVLGLEGGVARDDTSGATFERNWIGPTAAWPQLFGNLGGFSVGAHIEGGDLPGYSGWAGANLVLSKRVELLGRATAQIDSRPEGRDATIGLFGSVHAQVSDHFALQCTLLARLQPVALGNVPPDLMGGVFVDLGVRGEF